MITHVSENAVIAHVTRNSVGICVHNEEENIGALLDVLLQNESIDEILVVCSGCSDRSPMIVSKYAVRDKRIKLLVEPFQRGKASAINEILKRCKGGVLLIISGDVIPAAGAVDRLLTAMADREIGAIGANPIPNETEGDLAGTIGSLMWALHEMTMSTQSQYGSLNRVSGEMFCIRRNLVDLMPPEVVNDDDYLAIQVSSLRKKILYLVDAHVHIRLPESISDLVRQRSRVIYGHLQIRRMTGRTPRILEALVAVEPFTAISVITSVLSRNPRRAIFLIALTLIETVAFFKATISFILGKSYVPWRKIARSGPTTA